MTRGRGHDDAVGAEPRHAPAVKLDGKLAHARNVAFRNNNLVQRLETRLLRAFAPKHGVEHGALIEAVASVAPVFQCGVEIGKADLGKETEESKIHAEDGSTHGGKNARSGKQRTVAA